MTHQEMTICLWFDNEAEEAASFYTSLFSDSEIGIITRFGKEGFDHHGKPEGTAMAVYFRLNSMKFIAVNGGSNFKFNEAISIVINCETQEEIDHYWAGFTEEGREGPCGWLTDKYGVSWQITPALLPTYLSDTDIVRKGRVERQVFRMKKLDIAKLRAAYEGT